MRNRITILTLLILAIMILFSGCTDNSTAQKSELATVNSIEEIDAMLESAPVFIEMGAGRCPACVLQKPIVEELAAKYDDKVHFVYIDVDKQNQLAAKFNVYYIPDIFVIARSDNGTYKYVLDGDLTTNSEQAKMIGLTQKGPLEITILDAIRLR
ncbi:MAG: thioredoxin 1 [Candidatus Methanocomedens sp.]|nr:MAG: thioredoxin 1 [ANME-2 cluster archaeon]